MKHRTEFLDVMRETLKTKYEELFSLIKGQDANLKEVAHVVKDSADEASSSVMNKLQNSIQKSEIEEMKLIEDALERLKHDDYGICIDCGEPINTRRLEIYPYAARCITCQEKLER